MTYWNDPREDNYSFDQSFQWNAAMSNLNGMPVRTYKEPSSIIKLTEGGDTPQPDALNFYMPNGGTISLIKTGSPAVVELEYSLDGGATWTVWPEDGSGNRSLTLTAGQRMYVRNTSETSTRFSTNQVDYYQFAFSNTTEAHGNTNSLLCRNAEIVTALSPYCYIYMFRGCTSLVSAPKLLATTLAKYCYRSMFYGCSSIVTAPELPAITLATDCYRAIFYRCSSLAEIRTMMTDISAENCLSLWTFNIAASGDFYCPAELTIPTGTSGIPSGWTRHDI